MTPVPEVPTDASLSTADELKVPDVPDGADSFRASDPPSTWWGGQRDDPVTIP